MDRPTGNRWLKGFGLIITLLIFISLVSFSFQDPTITNLRFPMDGISNLGWLPGALIGGSLVEILGGGSLLIPLLMLNWLFTPNSNRSLFSYLAYGVSLLLIVATLYGLTFPAAELGLQASGLAGLAGSRWIEATTGVWGGIAILLTALVYCLTRLVKIPILRLAARDMGTFIKYFFRRYASLLDKFRRGTKESLSIIRHRSWRETGGGGTSLKEKLLRVGDIFKNKSNRNQGIPLHKNNPFGTGKNGEFNKNRDTAGKGAGKHPFRQQEFDGSKDGFDVWYATLDETNIDNTDSDVDPIK